jgi:hypothetical protein
MDNKIYLPYRFDPYVHQQNSYDAYRSEKYNQFVEVWHRRAGKDTTWFNIQLEYAFKRVGYHLYLLETIGQAREVIWDGIGRDGKKFIDFIPPELIESINNTEMKIKLVNGSILKYGGTDNYNAHMGTNPVSIVLSEYALQNPLAWQYLSPILAENKGWAAFIYTFRGNNHGYELYEQNKNNPDVYTASYTVLDTERHDGSPIVSTKEIDKMRRSGIPEPRLQQEFFNVPTSMEGAYFGEEMMKLEADGRICDFPINRTQAVSTYWDLGFGDSTAIWQVQKNGEYLDLIDYYENCLSSLDHYVNYLHDSRDKNSTVYADHFAPHDAHKRELSSGKSLVEIAAGLGIRFKVVPRINKKENAIEAARMIFPKIRIHKTNCKQGIKCLKEYHANFNEKLNVYGSPCHNWASHGADAFMAIAQMDKKAMRMNNNIIPNSINKGSVW